MSRKAGGIETMINVIETHINDVNTCDLGCAALGIMVVGDGK